MDALQLYGQLSLASLEEFGSFFTAFRHTAFRLELLDLYSVPEEESVLKQFLSGSTKPPDDFNKDWIKILSAATSAGKKFERVRLVREPIHDYLKFEVAWGYAKNIEAGEGVSVIHYGQMPYFKTVVPIFNDFWLFDDSHCYLMEYDFLGHFLGVRKLPSQHVDQYVDLKKEALSKAVDIKLSSLWCYASDFK